MCKKCVLYLSHKCEKVTKNRFEKIKSDLSDGDLVWLYDTKGNSVPNYIEDVPHFLFDSTSFNRLSYDVWKKDMIPGCCHYPLMEFYKKNKCYDRYWFIEWDVKYTGNWQHLFKKLEKDTSEFISSHIRKYSTEERYKWWSFDGKKRIKNRNKIRSFNPIFRISKNALEIIHEKHKKGLIGHNEVVIPTILKCNGYNISDLGGHGSFVPEKRINSNYLENDLDFSCSISPNLSKLKVKERVRSLLTTFRPGPKSRYMYTIKNKLYHPAKRYNTYKNIKRDMKQARLRYINFSKWIKNES